MKSINQALVVDHLRKVGSINIHEALTCYGMSGGTLTKVISDLRKRNTLTIERTFVTVPYTGRRYAKYTLTNAA